MLKDHYDKHEFTNLDDAKNRLNYLAGLSSDDLIDKEQFAFVPNYLRIEVGILPNPLRRLLNRCGSKRIYNIFGFRI